MRRLILLLISSCAVLLVTAQEDFFSDSIAVKHPEVKVKQPVIERRLNFDEPAFTDEFTLPDISIFHQPLLPDYNNHPSSPWQP